MSQLNSGIPEMCYLIWAGTFREFSICGSTFQEFLIWAATFGEFSICGSTFQRFLILGWHISGILDLRWHISGIPDLRLVLLKKFLENCVFLVCFPLQWISFWLLTLIYSDDIDTLQKNGPKLSFLRARGAQTFYYPIYGVTTACCVPWQSWKNTAGKSARGGLEFHICTYSEKIFFFKNNLESFPDCENVFCT